MPSDSKPPVQSPRELDSLLFDNLLHESSDALYFKDLESRFIRINDRQAKRFGLQDSRESTGKTDFDYFTKEHARPAFEDEQRVIATGKAIRDKEEKETWADGSHTWVSTSKLPLRDRQGAIIGTFGISRDISKRKKAEEALKVSEARLRDALDSINSDLGQACRMHEAMLADTITDHPRLRFSYCYRPMDQVGGDFYNAQRVTGGVGLFIGDMMGHGVTAALFIALLKFMLTQLIRVEGAMPNKLLEDLNRVVLEQMQTRFVTAQYAYFSFDEGKPGGRVRIADAGHPQPFFCRAGGKYERLNVRGSAALGVSDQYAASSIEIDLQQGDRLFFFTDGMYEAINAKNAMLGEDAFMALFENAPRTSVQAIVDAVRQGVTDFIGNTPISDDWCLVGVEVRELFDAAICEGPAKNAQA